MGPCKIVRQSSNPKAYYIEDPLGFELPYPVSIARMRPWNDRLTLFNQENTQSEDSPSGQVLSPTDSSANLVEAMTNCLFQVLSFTVLEALHHHLVAQVFLLFLTHQLALMLHPQLTQVFYFLIMLLEQNHHLKVF